jgi:hypothetical protein
MNEHLDAVRAQLESGSASAETLVVLYRAAEEAEQGRDVESLEEITRLAREVARGADSRLHSDAEHLIDLCEERLERTRTLREGASSSSAGDHIACPGCGRPVDSSAVRCRACGTLLV